MISQWTVDSGCLSNERDAASAVMIGVTTCIVVVIFAVPFFTECMKDGRTGYLVI